VRTRGSPSPLELLAPADGACGRRVRNTIGTIEWSLVRDGFVVLSRTLTSRRRDLHSGDDRRAMVWRAAIMRIAIGFDGSDFAKAAIDDLRRAGLPPHASALVISVGETLLPPVSATLSKEDAAVSHRVLATRAQALAQSSQALQDARAIAADGVARIRRLFPAWDVRAVPLVGTPAVMLIATADDANAHLIVVGSHGRSALGRLVLGSVSKAIATQSSRSVLVARHVIARGDSPIRVIVGIDGSPSADATVRSVSRRTWPDSTEIRVLAVDDTIRPTGTLKLVPPSVPATSPSPSPGRRAHSRWRWSPPSAWTFRGTSSATA